MRKNWLRYALALLLLGAITPALWQLGEARWIEYQWTRSTAEAERITKAGRPADALTELQQAFDAAAQLAQDDPRQLHATRSLAAAFADRGQLSDAYSLELRALQIVTRDHGPDSAEAANQLTRMAKIRLDEGQPQAAIGLLVQALSAWQGAAGGDHPDMLPTLQIMIDSQVAAKDLSASVPYFDWALGILRRTVGSDHPDVAPLELSYADVLEKLGKTELSRQFREHARSIAAPKAEPTAAAAPAPEATAIEPTPIQQAQ